MTQNKQDAEDLVQEASLRAYRYFDKFKPGTNFKAWIMTIARNIYINCYRKKLKEPQKIGFEEAEDFIGLREIGGAQEGIFSEVIESAIDKLPDELRDNMFYFSSIFKWFKEDFGDVIKFITKYLPEEDAGFIYENRPKNRYLNYDWALNGKS